MSKVIHREHCFKNVHKPNWFEKLVKTKTDEYLRIRGIKPKVVK